MFYFIIYVNKSLNTILNICPQLEFVIIFIGFVTVRSIVEAFVGEGLSGLRMRPASCEIINACVI